MGFPITDLMDEEACYATLVARLHPGGLACRRCHEADRMMAHRRHRAPILDFPASRTTTAPSGSTSGTASRMQPLGIGIDRRWRTVSWRPPRWTRMRGKTGVPQRDHDDPPRRRANQHPGHGSWESDRPPLGGVVGRDSGQVRLTVVSGRDTTTCPRWAADTPRSAIRQGSGRGTTRGRVSARNFLRPSRGVNQKYLHQHAAPFEWGSDVKRATVEFLHALLRVRHPISCPT